MSVKVKIEHWTVQLKGNPPSVFCYENDKERRRISVKKFEEKGMTAFPIALYRLIQGSLKNSNTYDRLMDKFFEWQDNR